MPETPPLLIRQIHPALVLLIPLNDGLALDHKRNDSLVAIHPHRIGRRYVIFPEGF